MDIFGIMSIILTASVVIAYLNHRFVGMQTTIAIMFSSLLLSLILILMGFFGFDSIETQIAENLAKIDFHKLLMHGMLSFLLFSGALTVNLNDLNSRKWEIISLATITTIASTALIGFASFYLLQWIGIGIPFIYCFLFGALISPTDPIAVLSLCKQLNAPRYMTVTIAGESLFNDGVGIVMFITLYSFAFGNGAKANMSWEGVSLLFFQQAIGGILFGLALGLLGYWLIKPINEHKIEILITLAMTTGGYALAEILGISGPLAMVTAGIFIGNQGRLFSMSHNTRRNLDNFWELVDEILNAILFLLIGLEILVIPVAKNEIIAGLLAIPMVLIIRFITVSIPISLFKFKKDYSPHFIKILTWGGLRGGLAVALALALPPGSERQTILGMTYAVVVFAILVQGMSVKKLVKLSSSAEGRP